jgi:ubiquinone/menaquinone biosynthesis C-methylase UbiE
LVDRESEDQYPVGVETENTEELQKKNEFSPLRLRPFITGLPARIDEYEEDVARFFHLKTGLDYYHAIDQIVDFVVNTGRRNIVDLLADTAVFTLRLAERKDFHGSVYSVDSNVTLLERAKQRAVQMNLQKSIEFKQVLHETRLPLPDCCAEVAVSIFDLHRHSMRQYLAEIMRTLEPEGIFIIAVLTEPKAAAPFRLWRWVRLKYIHKNPTEADTVYPDREEIIKSLFGAGFRQVIIQEKNTPTVKQPGVFNLIAATK